MDDRPKIEGIGIAVNGDLQAAIDLGGRRYLEKFGQSPTHVALPPGTDPATVNLFGVLNLARPAGARVVIVGRAIGDTNGARQMELFSDE